MLFTSPLLYVVDVNTTVKIMESQPNWIDLYFSNSQWLERREEKKQNEGKGEWEWGNYPIINT